MRDLPIPAAGGDINALRDFTNTRTDEEFVLFCGCTVGLFNTFGNYTTTIFCGPAGSAKTSACRVMRRLVDPNKVDTKPFSSVRDLRHAAGSTHVIGLQNISGISGEFSDKICHASRQAYGITGIRLAPRMSRAQLCVRSQAVLAAVSVHVVERGVVVPVPSALGFVEMGRELDRQPHVYASPRSLQKRARRLRHGAPASCGDIWGSSVLRSRGARRETSSRTGKAISSS
jgi:hypothetical protein